MTLLSSISIFHIARVNVSPLNLALYDTLEYFYVYLLKGLSVPRISPTNMILRVIDCSIVKDMLSFQVGHGKIRKYPVSCVCVCDFDSCLC